MNQQITPMQAAFARGVLSRRTLMLGAMGVGATALAACGSEGKSPTATGTATPSAKAAQDMSDTEKVVNWSNWQQYIDVSEDEKSRPTLDAFTKASRSTTPRTTTTTTSSTPRSGRCSRAGRTPAVTSGARPTGWSRD
jgi:spermidine/putrescine-binding protein